MVTATLLTHDLDMPTYDHHLCILSRYGVHVGHCTDLDRSTSQHEHPALTYDQQTIRAVTTWHPVPRWMTPREALTAFAA